MQVSEALKKFCIAKCKLDPDIGDYQLTEAVEDLIHRNLITQKDLDYLQRPNPTWLTFKLFIGQYTLDSTGEIAPTMEFVAPKDYVAPQ